jgi:YggT family protein
MFIVGNFLGALATIVDYILLLYLIALFVVVAVSWFAPRSRHPFIQFLRGVTHPLLAWIRRVLPFVVQGGFDLSPIVAFFGIHFLRRFLVPSLYQLAARMQ